MAHNIFPSYPTVDPITVLGQPKATPFGGAQSAALAYPARGETPELVGTKGVLLRRASRGSPRLRRVAQRAFRGRRETP